MALLGSVMRLQLGDMRTEAELKALAASLGTTPDVPREQRITNPKDALAIAQSTLASLDIVSAKETETLKGLRVSAIRELLTSVAQRISTQIRHAMRERIWGLYVIIDPAATAQRDPMDIAKAAIHGGAHILQLRDKTRDKGDQLPLATALHDLCREYEVLYLINDHADLARAIGADGVHVGQHDLPVAGARLALTPEQILGRSNATLEEALESHAQGVDYIAVGAIYPTATKEHTRPAKLDTLRKVRAALKGPIVAIGGINSDNVAPVVEAGADSISVISAVTLAPDPEKAARALVESIKAAGGKA
jgi:thiamine-phosphate diphosphorylase